MDALERSYDSTRSFEMLRYEDPSLHNVIIISEEDEENFAQEFV